MIGGSCMDVSVQTRRIADQSAGQAKRTFDKAATATAQGTRRVEQNALTAVNEARECYIRMLDMAQENTVAAFDLARDLATVQTPSEFVEICTIRTRDAYSAFSEQTKEMAELAQKVAKSAVPLTNGLTVRSVKRSN